MSRLLGKIRADSAKVAKARFRLPTSNDRIMQMLSEETDDERRASGWKRQKGR